MTNFLEFVLGNSFWLFYFLISQISASQSAEPLTDAVA